jgi:peptidoglycan/LPS O-acetylase OafA/YrhL
MGNSAAAASDDITGKAGGKTAPGQKLVPLEGLRGIAAAVVVIYHLVLGFTAKGVSVVPQGHGMFDTLGQFGLGLLNGSAAVAVFFVLSGFILSLPFSRDRRISRVLVALLKRWPRLAFVTVLACLFAYALILCFGHSYKDAASLSGAGWMASHGNSPIDHRNLTWAGAVHEGLIAVFTKGEVRFDSPLWTMRIELFCSFAVFLAAPKLFGIRSWPLRVGLIAIAVLSAGTTFPYTHFSDFLCGTVLAMLFAEKRLPAIPGKWALPLGFVVLYLFSFTYEQTLLIHAPLKAIMPAGDSAHFVWDAGAVLSILILLGNPTMNRLFSHSWAIWLGLLSFPIYLLQGPIMLTVGAKTLVAGSSYLGVNGSEVVAAIISIALTLACALPLARLDQAWLAVLTRVTKPLLAKRAGGGGGLAEKAGAPPLDPAGA